MKKFRYSAAGIAFCLLLSFPGLSIAQNDLPQIIPVEQTSLSTPLLNDVKFVGFKMILPAGFDNEVAHRHQGDIFGYVLKGAVEMVMENNMPKTYSSGEIFHEKYRELHRSYRNPDTSHPAEVLMIFISPAIESQETANN